MTAKSTNADIRRRTTIPYFRTSTTGAAINPHGTN